MTFSISTVLISSITLEYLENSFKMMHFLPTDNWALQQIRTVIQENIDGPSLIIPYYSEDITHLLCVLRASFEMWSLEVVIHLLHRQAVHLP